MRVYLEPYQNQNNKYYYYVRTGEYRVPFKDEFYLSGAIPEVYKAPANLCSKFPIMHKLEDLPEYIYNGDGIRYKLDPELGD